MPPARRSRSDLGTQSSAQVPVTNGTRRRVSDASEGEYEVPATQSSPNKQGIPEADIQLMVKNFVRLALACEHTRTPIRRDEVTKRVFVNDHKRCFPLIFERTQERLKSTFGMELVELPAKDRSRGMTMTQQRKVAHSQASLGNNLPAAAKGIKSWVLQNTLPPEMKQISQRQHIESERNYNGILMVLLIVVVMSDDQACTENRAISAFERLGWHPNTPAGTFDEIVAKMVRQGYLERLRDEESMEGAYKLHIGPRGKLETLRNREELFSVISKIYGHDDDADAKEKLQRVVQDTLDADDEVHEDAAEDEDEEVDETLLRNTQTNGFTIQSDQEPRRTRTRRKREDDDDGNT